MRKSSRRSAGKSHRKSTLPQKTCAVCGRPFSWRKKWEKAWEEVKYCSDRCRGAAKKKEPSSEAGDE